MRIRFAGRTDIGKQRDHNEDAILVMDSYRTIVVADGLGGHSSGHIASGLCVSTLADFFSVTVDADATWPFPYNEALTEEENYLQTGLRLANRRIFDRSLLAMNDFGMGTTCVGAMLSRNARRVSIAHVGDSRAYRLRAGQLEQLTRDHSLVSDALHAAPWMTPEEVARMPTNVITRALGIREDVLVDLYNEGTQIGDVYLLCSDGLTGVVGNEEITSIVDGAVDLEDVANELVDRANVYGGPDNITVALARIDEHGPETAPRPRPSETRAAPDPGIEKTDPGHDDDSG
ncbi:MAG: protein phosphatase 2C domain-containing protein [Polyangiaceae bacterium]